METTLRKDDDSDTSERRWRNETYEKQNLFDSCLQRAQEKQEAQKLRLA